MAMCYLQTLSVTLAATTSITWKSLGEGWNVSSLAIAQATPTARLSTLLQQQSIDIRVGDRGMLTFNPESVTVLPGTLLRFDFLGLNHTLTQSSFDDPCHSNLKFDTGFHQFHPQNISGRFQVEYMVNSSRPQWFFCAQNAPRPHCASGMVFSLNPDVSPQNFADNARHQSRISTSAENCHAAHNQSTRTSITAMFTQASSTPNISRPTLQEVSSTGATNCSAFSLFVVAAFVIFLLA
jgi:plastocyanin